MVDRSIFQPHHNAIIVPNNANNAKNTRNANNTKNTDNQLCQSFKLWQSAYPLKVTLLNFQKETEIFKRKLKGVLVKKGY
ncbi:Uncharacterised protein [Capnocytophaga ochracea]|uniref:Uncharacterized protein n=1 Tax=Capnocytophaga ochracea TaxID=1018 RepID=A0A2X2RK44_CAPOC|nr:Uncharacterised protein [Capnocytophaga ochracea]